MEATTRIELVYTVLQTVMGGSEHFPNVPQCALKQLTLRIFWYPSCARHIRPFPPLPFSRVDSVWTRWTQNHASFRVSSGPSSPARARALIRAC